MKFTEEHKRKLSKARKKLFLGGYKLPPEARRKISESHKGKPTWNKGLTKEHPIIAKIVKNLGDYAKGKKGKEHPNWKGGKIVSNGYVYLYNKELGKCFGGKYIKRADLVWYENTGELIKPPYELHHINGEKQDDRFENLVKLKKSTHSLHHLKETYEKIVRNEKGQFKK